MKPLNPNVASDLSVHAHAFRLRRHYVAPLLTCFGLVQDLTQAGSKNNNEAANDLCPQMDTTKTFNSNCMALA